MPKTLADEHIALRLLSEAPEDIDAITAEEFNAGTALECRIMDYRLSPTASDLVTQGEFCEATNAQAPTRSNYEGSVTVFRYLDGDGVSDAVNDTAWEAVKEKGTTLYLVEREGPEHDATGVDGQEYSYFEVITDHPQVPTDRGGFIRREVPLYVQKAALNKVIGGDES